MRTDNPYDSPRVLRAVLEEIIERLQVGFESLRFDPAFLQLLQNAADQYCWAIAYRGVPLLRLITIEASLSTTEEGVVNFTFRPRSEDGRWLLEKMDLVEKAPELPTVKEIHEKAEAQGIKITRIVEI